MVLVEYSDSESSESSGPEEVRSSTQRHQSVKRKRISESDLPPLPDSFHDLYASTSRVSNQDDPSLHGGRQRAIPHMDGNWPTHVYIEWLPSTEQSDQLNKFFIGLKHDEILDSPKIHSLLQSDLGTELPLHISLSKPIVLHTDQRQAFTDKITKDIDNLKLSPFEVSVTGFDWVSNDEKTRWFLVMRLDRAPQDGLNQLLRVSNGTVQNFGQPPLYAESRSPADVQYLPAHKLGRNTEFPKGHKPSSPSSILQPTTSQDVDSSSSFHVSIAWALNAAAQHSKEKLENASPGFQVMKIGINSVKIKIGNNVSSVSLASKLETTNRLLEG